MESESHFPCSVAHRTLIFIIIHKVYYNFQIYKAIFTNFEQQKISKKIAKKNCNALSKKILLRICQ